MAKSFSKSEMNKLNIQFLFVTAAPIEKESFKKKMKPVNNSEKTQYIGRLLTYNIGFLGNYLVAHVHCEQQGSLKPDAAMLTIKNAYEEMKPNCVIMVGIAYGANEEKQKIGDILISKKVQPYNSIRVSTSKTGKIKKDDRNICVKPGRSILNQFEHFQFSDGNICIHCGTILSGEELIDNLKYKNYLINKFSNSNKDWNNEDKIIGGEMEGVSLSSVLSSEENQNWIVIKSICDWADGEKAKNKKERQSIAANNATNFCFEFFKTELPQNILGTEINQINYHMFKDLSIINGYLLFAYRNDACITFHRLEQKTKISRVTLREFEEFKVENNIPIFKKTSIENIEKIRKVLNCGMEITQEETDEKFISFFENKNRKGFSPISDAKVVIFDFDGTLTINDKHRTSWQTVWEYLGYSLTFCDSLHRKFTNGELSHADWCQMTADYFKAKKLSRKNMQEIAASIKLIDGLTETLEILKENQVEMYICSGSIDVIIKDVLKENISYFTEIKSNEFAYDENADILKAIIGTSYDFAGKAAYIEKIAKQHGIKTKDIIFVGNSNNDEAAIKSGAKTLVVNPHFTDGYNRKYWKYYAGYITNFKEALPFILPSKYHLSNISEKPEIGVIDDAIDVEEKVPVIDRLAENNSSLNLIVPKSQTISRENSAAIEDFGSLDTVEKIAKYVKKKVLIYRQDPSKKSSVIKDLFPIFSTDAEGWKKVTDMGKFRMGFVQKLGRGGMIALKELLYELDGTKYRDYDFFVY